MKIAVTNQAVALEVKRCYLPIEITDTCPTCGVEVTRYLNSDYLSFPKINTPINMAMYHHIELPDSDEEHSWNVMIVLRIMAEAAP
ncbi:MAG TPA: hypothetical protein VIU64_07910 [Polyangia bacterium]